MPGKAIANLEVVPMKLETRGYNEDGALVCMFRREGIVPAERNVKERDGDRPGPS